MQQGERDDYNWLLQEHHRILDICKIEGHFISSTIAGNFNDYAKYDRVAKKLINLVIYSALQYID